MRKIGAVLIGGISFLAACAGLYGFGLTEGQSRADADIKAAEERGYSRGYQTAEVELNSDRRQTEWIASLLRVVDSQSAENRLPEQFRIELQAALRAAAEGDPARAASLLPGETSLAPESGCLSSGYSITLAISGAVTNCETGLRAAFSKIRSDRATFAFAGQTRGLTPGENIRAPADRAKLCHLVYEGNVSTDEQTAVRVSFDCLKPDED